MNREVTASDFQTRRLLCNQELRIILAMAREGKRRKTIERVIGCSHGAICGVIRRLRAAGVDAPRPAWWRE
jgi:hypothetical protein